MSTKGYTTRGKIENYLLINIDPTFNAQVDSWIEEIEKYIDQITGRNFKADIVATAKYYDGDNTTELLIDDAVAITEINVGGTILAADTDPLLADGDFILYPANTLPTTKVSLRGSIFPALPQRCIKITGKWGFCATPPADIQTAATILVAGIINYSWESEGEIQSMSIGRYSVTYKNEKQWNDFEQAKEILNYYRKYQF